MKSVTIKTTSGPLKISIPSDISEITIDMLQRLTPRPGDVLSPLEQISALSGVPKEYNPGQPDAICLEDIRDISDLNVFDDTLQVLAYQIASFVTVQEIPKYVTLQIGQKNKARWFGQKNVTVSIGKTVAVRSNLGIEPAGAYMEAKQVIGEDLAEWLKQNPIDKDASPEELKAHKDKWTPLISSQIKVLALYLYQPATGEKFTTRAAEAFEKVVSQLPITQALPIARYFFLKYPNLAKPKVNTYRESLQTLKSKQV